jgi:(2Fe-2S) ferredoxin
MEEGMTQFKAQILVCVKTEGAADRRHCGDKGGPAVLQAAKEAVNRLGLAKDVLVSKTGCTSQHAIAESDQATVVVYGPTADRGGVWYRLRASDVEEVVREHLQHGRVVQRLMNPAMCVRFWT